MIAAFVRFLNNSSLLVGLGAAALTFETFFIIGIPPSLWVIVEVFFFTWTGYLFLRRNESPRSQIAFIYIAVTGSITCLFLTNFFGWKIFLISGTIVLLYNLSEKNLPRFARFIPRRITFIKPASVGMAWALMTSALPISLAYDHREIFHAAMIFSNFFFTTALAMCDDIKDMQRDKGEIKTMPLALGVNLTKGIVAVHICVAAALFFFIKNFQFDGVTIGCFTTMTLFIVLTIWIKPNRNRQLQSLLIDGSILLRALTTILIVIFS